MIPPFDNKTKCLPPGYHKASFEEFKQRFVDDFPQSNTREEIFEEYIRHCSQIIPLEIAEKQWINGSYTKDEDNPNDIDLLTEFNGIEMDKKGITLHEVENLTVDIPLEVDGGLVHSFPVVWYPEEEEELYKDYQNTKLRYLFSLWGIDKEYNLKGLIEFDIGVIEGALIEK
ncbi:MAG: DUF6932 family protein [Methanobacterium sp.]